MKADTDRSVLTAVVNPRGDLRFAESEAAHIAEHFVDPRLLPGAGARSDKVIRACAGATYLHFACHAGHDWTDVMRSGLRLSPPDRSRLVLQNGPGWC